MENKFRNTDKMGKRKGDYEGEEGTTGLEGKDKERTKEESNFEDYTNSNTDTMGKHKNNPNTVDYEGEEGTTGLEDKNKNRTNEESHFEDYTNSNTDTIGKRKNDPDTEYTGEEGTTDVERKHR